MNHCIVSLIIPVYNAEKYLKCMLDSIMDQTYEYIEVVAVNDASTDSSLKILEDYKLKFISRGFLVKIVNCTINGGLSSAINHGLEAASGEYVCFPDADDELDPDYVKAMLDTIKQNPDSKWVRCDYTIVSEIENRSWDIILPKQSIYKNDYFDFISNFVPHNAWNMMVKRKYLDFCTGGTILASRLTQEWSLLLPLSYHSNYSRCNKKLYKYVLRKGAMSSWINGEINSALKHIDDLIHLNEDVILSMNIPTEIINVSRKAFEMFYTLMKYRVCRKKELFEKTNENKNIILNLVEPYVKKNFAEKINDPELLVRFAFDKILEMNNNINLYEKYMSVISQSGYIIFMDKPGREMYNATCMAFGQPEVVSEIFEIDKEYVKLPKICLIQNSGIFNKLKKTLGGDESLYFDYRDVCNAIREWAYLKGWK